jgi:hypothetical protein
LARFRAVAAAEYFADAIPSRAEYVGREILPGHLTAAPANLRTKIAVFPIVAPAVSQKLTVRQKNFSACAQVFPMENVS